MRTALGICVSALVALGATACGGAAPRDGSSSELLSVRPDGERGALVGYDARTGERAFSLPPGMLSADGRRYFAVAGGELRSFDPSDGRLLAEHPLPGTWSLGGVSPGGGQVALERRGTIAILDTATGRRTSTVRLGRAFEVDALAPGKLFLIQHFAAGRYAVRAFDLATGRLRPGALRVKGEETMAGEPISALPSADGGWLLTLYLDLRRKVAFVHALNLRRASAACLDLPSTGPLSELRAYSLAVSPDGRDVYAANPSLGIVADVRLPAPRVASVISFMPRAVPSSASVVGGDGRVVYTAGGTEIWRYDVASRLVRGPRAAGARVGAIAVGPGGRRVFVVRPDGTLSSLAM